MKLRTILLTVMILMLQVDSEAQKVISEEIYRFGEIEILECSYVCDKENKLSKVVFSLYTTINNSENNDYMILFKGSATETFNFFEKLVVFVLDNKPRTTAIIADRLVSMITFIDDVYLEIYDENRDKFHGMLSENAGIFMSHFMFYCEEKGIKYKDNE